MLDLLTNPIVFSTIISGVTWLGHKLLGKRADTKAAKVAATLAQCSAECLQLTLTAGPDMTVARLIIQCKAIFAIRLAQVQVYEKDRAPYQPLIDKAISEIVLQFIADHGERKALVLPVTAKLPSLLDVQPALRGDVA